MIYLCKPRNLSFINIIKDIIYTAFHIPEREKRGEGGGREERKSYKKRNMHSFYQTNEQIKCTNIDLSDYY